MYGCAEGTVERGMQRKKSVGDGALEWRVWPAADKPARSLAIGILVLGLSTATALSYGHVLYGLAAFVILFFATTNHYLPTTYCIDADGVEAKTPFSTTRKPWDAFTAFFEDDSGIFLSPRSKLTWTAQRRGIYLRCPELKDPVREYVQKRIKSEARD